MAAAKKMDAEGRDVVYHQLDITDRESIAALAGDMPRLAPRLDVLVNNAGVGSWGADRAASAHTIAVNYFGSRDVTDALLPFVPRGGRVVMVSSGMGELSSGSDQPATRTTVRRDCQSRRSAAPLFFLGNSRDSGRAANPPRRAIR